MDRRKAKEATYGILGLFAVFAVLIGFGVTFCAAFANFPGTTVAVSFFALVVILWIGIYNDA